MKFREKFEIYSNADLLRIIENPDDYQLQAVETAKNIFAERQLSEMEIKIAKYELEVERQEKLRKEQQKQALEAKAKNIGESALDQINPIQKEIPTSEKTIKIISIFWGVLFLFQIYIKFRMLKFMFTDSYAEWNWGVMLSFLPLIIIPTATILFYMRKKMGWLLLTIFLVYSAASAIGEFILSIIKIIRISILGNLFSPYSPITPILSFLFFGGTLWVISKKNIRTIYSISKRTMILAISISIGVLIVALEIINLKL